MTELLAPAGSREAFDAALACGADAIYLGGRQFGARQYAPNFSHDELASAVRKAHLHGSRVYVTVNTLVDDSELPDLREYLGALYDIGVDAAILQDVGVARIARRIVPNLPIHASTQMTVHNLPGVNLLAEYGFERVILARELSMDEISHICRGAKCQVEVFVHGALCICYSGQCLMSSLIGGRSGNRGRCAQPCRLPYQLEDAAGRNLLQGREIGEYLLSPKDFQTLEVLPQLIKAGVASFKIEGRMKRPEYVGVVTDIYRRAIDRYQAGPDTYEVSRDDLRDIEQIFNRGFTTAHLFGKSGETMMSHRRPNNRGVLAGRVVNYLPQERSMVLKLDGALAVGDIIEAWVKVGGRVNIEVAEIRTAAGTVTEAAAGDEVVLNVSAPVRPGDRVFKTFDIRLTEKSREWFAAGSAKGKIPVTIHVEAAVGLPLRISLSDRTGKTGSALSQSPGQAALKRPLTEEYLEAQCGRIGNTDFVMERFVANIDGEVMVPVSEINEARRQAVAALEKARLAVFARKKTAIGVWPAEKDVEAKNDKRREAVRAKKLQPQLSVQVDTEAQAHAVLQAGADWLLISGERYQRSAADTDFYRHIVGMARKMGCRVQCNLPRIMRGKGEADARARLELFAALKVDAVGIPNHGSLALAMEYPGLPIYADTPFNVFNSESVEFLRAYGLVGAVLSPELTLQQVGRIAARTDFPLEVLVHGKIPLMVSEFCVGGGYLGELDDGGGCNGVCHEKELFLKDRMGERFPVKTDDSCRMHILNAKNLSMLPFVAKLLPVGLDRLRIDAVHMEPDDAAHTVAAYRQAIDTGKDGNDDMDGNTRGHYFRGVL